MTSRVVFVAPPLTGLPTGGTLYNREIVCALEARGLLVEVVEPAEAKRILGASETGAVVVDTLYLEEWRDLAAHNAGRAPLWLLVHYLPTLVRLGRAPVWEELCASEREALSGAAGLVVTGDFMAETLLGFGVDLAPVHPVPPGVSGGRAQHHTDVRPPFTVAVVGHLIEGKGALPLLEALSLCSSTRADWSLLLIGSLDVEPAYAAACRRVVETSWLRDVVQFTGPLAHERCLDAIGTVDVLVSSSRMESFGMALSEARAAGVPILALSAGNTPHHVKEATGGRLVSTVSELAQELLLLVDDTLELKRLTHLARAGREERSWSTAAEEFTQALVPR